jgi:WD40 repeat protein
MQPAEAPQVRLERGVILEAGAQIVRSLAWSPDGTKLAAGCSDRSLRIWTGTNRKPYAQVTLDRYG